MIGSRVATSLTRAAGLALVTDGVVGLAVPGQRERDWARPRQAWRRGVKRVAGEAVTTPIFAVVEIAVGAAVIAVVPRLLSRR